jgi:RNA polymerase sigma-70 factor (ECF subfamily)
MSSAPQNIRLDFDLQTMCHQAALNGRALKLTKNQSDAEDLVQNTLIRAYRNFDKFQTGSNFKAWLLKIMTNEYINQYRHHWRERELLDKNEPVSENIPDPASELTDSDINSDLEDFGDEVSNALKLVPDDYRKVVIMSDVQELSYKEISDTLSIPMGTVMSRLFRGRQILRKNLTDYATSCGIKCA